MRGGSFRGAETLRARAESIGTDVEPELTIAVDAMFPNSILMASLKALSETFGCLPVTLFTEGLGTPEQRLRDGVVRLAIYCLLSTGAIDLEAEYLTAIRVVPVVATSHPLAAEPLPLGRDKLEPQVQLVLTDRTPLSHSSSGGIISHRIWRFADLGTRLEFLLAGFGWCNMPVHMVEDHIAAGPQAPHLDRDRRVRFPDPRGPRTRPRAGPGRTLAARRPAPAAEDHQASVKHCPVGLPLTRVFLTLPVGRLHLDRLG